MVTPHTPASVAPAVHETHPVDVSVVPALTDRNRLTCAFRPILAIPHLILVGGPAAFALSWLGESRGDRFDWSMGGGVIGAVAVATAIIAWFAIVFGAKFPEGLWKLSAYYMRWRVKAVAYLAMFRDEYPPFGEGEYPVSLTLAPPTEPRDRLSIFLRLILALPHIVILWALGIAWAIASIVAWFAILFTGNYPPTLYQFAVDVFRWSTRVEVYLLLLRDEYPPFSFTAR
jgi:hypothetical protein